MICCCSRSWGRWFNTLWWTVPSTCTGCYLVWCVNITCSHSIDTLHWFKLHICSQQAWIELEKRPLTRTPTVKWSRHISQQGWIDHVQESRLKFLNEWVWLGSWLYWKSSTVCTMWYDNPLELELGYIWGFHRLKMASKTAVGRKESEKIKFYNFLPVMCTKYKIALAIVVSDLIYITGNLWNFHCSTTKTS